MSRRSVQLLGDLSGDVDVVALSAINRLRDRERPAFKLEQARAVDLFSVILKRKLAGQERRQSPPFSIARGRMKPAFDNEPTAVVQDCSLHGKATGLFEQRISVLSLDLMRKWNFAHGFNFNK